MCNLLNLHPRISCVGEFHWHRFLEPAHQNFRAKALFKRNPALQTLVLEGLDRMIKQTLIAAANPAATWIGDRNPSKIDTDILCGAHHFNIIRDGRDVLVSRVYHLFNRSEVTRWFEIDQELRNTLQRFQANPNYFRENPTALLCHEPMIRESAIGWASLIQENETVIEQHPGLPIMSVRYEQLHTNTDELRAQMYRFLDLDPAEAAPLDDTTRPGFPKEKPNKFYRKGEVGDWRNYMTPQAKQWFNEEAGEILVKLGYAESLDY